MHGLSQLISLASWRRGDSMNRTATAYLTLQQASSYLQWAMGFNLSLLVLPIFFRFLPDGGWLSQYNALTPR